MQTPSIPGITNLGAPASTNKTPNGNGSEPRFGQMLERQISQREATKPAEAPKPENRQQGTKAPVNSANSANKSPTASAGKSSAASANAKQEQATDTTAPPSTATADASTEAAAKTDSAKATANTKDSTTAAADEDKKIADPADAALNASAAIMALVANAGNAASQVATPTDRSANTTTTDTPRTAAIDLAAKASGRQTAASITADAIAVDTAASQAVKANVDAFSGEFGAALQTAGKVQDTEANLAALPDLARTAGSDIAQVTPQLQQAALEIAAPAGPHPGNVLAPRVGNDSWNQALSQRMVWMVAGAEQTASLTLNPPDLGPMQVVLHVSNGQADASFFAAQPEVRQALEAAMPKLREMLGEAGVSLGQTSVSAGQPQQQQASDRRSGGTTQSGTTSVETSGAIAGGTTRIVGGNGLVDTFA